MQTERPIKMMVSTPGRASSPRVINGERLPPAHLLGIALGLVALFAYTAITPKRLPGVDLGPRALLAERRREALLAADFRRDMEAEVRAQNISLLEVFTAVENAVHDYLPRARSVIEHWVESGEEFDASHYATSRGGSEDSAGPSQYRPPWWVSWVVDEADEEPVAFTKPRPLPKQVHPPPRSRRLDEARWVKSRPGGGVYICAVEQHGGLGPVPRVDVVEWFEHYVESGVEQMVWYDPYGLESVRWLTHHFGPFLHVVNATSLPGVRNKHEYAAAAFRHCAVYAQDHGAAWLAALDLDEYVVVEEEGQRLGDFLDDMSKRSATGVGGIALHYRYFDGAGDLTAEQSERGLLGPVCRFRSACKAPLFKLSGLYTRYPYKTFMRPAVFVEWDNKHRIEYELGYGTLLTDGTMLSDISKYRDRVEKNSDTVLAGAWINHYLVGSFEEYLRRMYRRMLRAGSETHSRLQLRLFFSFVTACYPVGDDILASRRCGDHSKSRTAAQEHV